MGKKYDNAVAKMDLTKAYSINEAIKMALENKFAKFDETLELHVRLGVDSRQADQQVRGTVVLPHGTGKTVRILVIAKGDKVAEAQKAGADYVGAEDMVAKIQGGWLDFDVCITTPDMMGIIGRVAKILGPKGLMPNPKSGTVTPNITNAVRDAKGGKVEYRLDKFNNVHCIFGKASFGVEKLVENYTTIINAIIKAKPSAAKGTYLKNVSIATTMGPGIQVAQTM